MPSVKTPIVPVGMQKFYKTPPTSLVANFAEVDPRGSKARSNPVVPRDKCRKVKPGNVQHHHHHHHHHPHPPQRTEDVAKREICDTVVTTVNLTKALETFDKILSEFAIPQRVAANGNGFVLPKLQKAKTCSIIESRCILKKAAERDSGTSNGRHAQLTKTKSLWNLNDMDEMHSKIPVPSRADKYSTYKITNRTSVASKLDVKTRILKKTLASPPPPIPSPVPPERPPRRIERRPSDLARRAKKVPEMSNAPAIPPKKPQSLTTKSRTSDGIELPPKINAANEKIQKTRSVWEMAKPPVASRPLSRAKSNTSITGSSSKIPVVRGTPPPPNRFASARALFSPTPGDLNRADRPRECAATNKKPTAAPQQAPDGLDEINRVRARIQQKKLANKNATAALESRSCDKARSDNPIPAAYSPVKSIISKMEMNAAKDAKPREADRRKLSLSSSKSLGSSEEKIYEETHSDCSDDSGHVSNEGECLPSSTRPDLISDLTVLCKVEAPTFQPVPAERRIQPSSETEVLLRAGALQALEKARAERLKARITRFQALCRGVLARRALARRRVQEVAVRCLQRNVRAFLAVRDWPWWRLLVRITPLLAVHRTEDQLKAKTEELETLRMKVEKLDQERSALKHENDKLENKLSEMTAELAVEQAAGSLASERLSAETAERLRLEKELLTTKATNTNLQQTSERLETELMYARAETNGSVASETGECGAGSDSEGSGESGRYKRRLQVALRELEAARRQLRQQHEDDLEQLVMLKKQLEKKAADAYEEAEEQRQVAAQWKRKAQKAANDANDVKLLLDEQGARATLLERRQRKFDAECQQLREEARRERQTRERLQREHDSLMAEKCALEQTLTDIRSELDMKEEKLSFMQRELDDLTYGGKTEEEVGVLKKLKHDLEIKCHDQEEELDELAGQVQLLESHKVRLEMSLEQQRKAARLEAAQREEELEEVRAQSTKKIKALESQLEMEHSERTLVLRERHELERRLAALEESARADAAERDQREQRAKRDLRRYKALARDAQVVLERREQDAGAKAQLRQLRDKLDDAEVALRAAQKARQVAESELAEALSMAEEAGRGRREAEMRATQAQREAASARAQLEEAEEEAADVMKKYRACVSSLSEEQRAAKEAIARAAAAEEEARTAREKVSELSARLASADSAVTAGHAAQHDRLELRAKELEASLELEQTARTRLEAQATRAREAASASAQAHAAAQQRELITAEELRKVMRTVRELREELAAVNAKCDECVRARSEAEARLEEERASAVAARADLRATNQRLLLLQQAIADDMSPDNGSDSDNDSCSSDESIETFLANHKLSPIPAHGSATPKSNEGGRHSRSSAASSKHVSPTKE